MGLGSHVDPLWTPILFFHPNMLDPGSHKYPRAARSKVSCGTPVVSKSCCYEDPRSHKYPRAADMLDPRSH